jgi:uncharacterized protein with PIN domain
MSAGSERSGRNSSSGGPGPIKVRLAVDPALLRLSRLLRLSSGFGAIMDPYSDKMNPVHESSIVTRGKNKE